ncbi:hypothetical protein BS47DRAFT_1344722 [Hydnum rufescens UP504]|uniref:Uncharacterized protein n=1 Tax=Hydnum rufescens UP504 TaxID=1448309 RepID=A0A9P6AX79_9AGAM|nr:hypothetical protein BS47DRAFT_1344722 [Hydnum rufescens UP504]
MFEIDSSPKSGLLVISRGTSILLLTVYVGCLVFQLKTHACLFQAPPSLGEQEEGESMSMISAALS